MVAELWLGFFDGDGGEPVVKCGLDLSIRQLLPAKPVPFFAHVFPSGRFSIFVFVVVVVLSHPIFLVFGSLVEEASVFDMAASAGIFHWSVLDGSFFPAPVSLEAIDLCYVPLSRNCLKLF